MTRARRCFHMPARSRAAIGALLAAGLALGACASQAADVQVVATGLQFPEGPVFVGDVTYFVDYSSSRVSRLVGKAVEVVWQQDGCGANGLAPVPGGLLVACYDSGTLVRISLDGKVEETIRADEHGRPFSHPNDLAADDHGGIYFSASGSATVLGKVYYRNAGGRVQEVAADIHYANGLAVAPDGKTLYLAESEASRLLALPIAADGRLGPAREFVKLADILPASGEATLTPDGVRVDRDGRLFVGLYRGGGIAIISSTAKLLHFVRLPGAHHANLALAPDGRTILVTSTDDRPDGSYRGALLAVPNPIAR